jgi:hypothetical protein
MGTTPSPHSTLALSTCVKRPTPNWHSCCPLWASQAARPALTCGWHQSAGSGSWFPALAALAPDLDLLRDACDHLGLLGAYVHSPPSPEGSLAARMFAPSIGVPEDIANANSTACLAAHLAGIGVTEIAVDMGDAFGCPATITATARPSRSGSWIQVGGTAHVAGEG